MECVSPAECALQGRELAFEIYEQVGANGREAEPNRPQLEIGLGTRGFQQQIDRIKKAFELWASWRHERAGS